MARSLNRVQLIGNLTRDPELRYTPQGTAVCTIGLATNRSWTTDSGEKHEETEFHRIVAWNKLAELCSQFLVKGRKIYVEGRLATRSWTTQEGQQRSQTEIVIDDMILLDSKGSFAPKPAEEQRPEPVAGTEPEVKPKRTVRATSSSDEKSSEQEAEGKEKDVKKESASASTTSSSKDEDEIPPDD